VDGGSGFVLSLQYIDGHNAVLLAVSKGQFLSSIMSDEYCRIKFDDSKALICGYYTQNDSKDCFPGLRSALYKYLEYDHSDGDSFCSLLTLLETSVYE